LFPRIIDTLKLLKRQIALVSWYMIGNETC